MQGTPFGRYRLIELVGRGGMGEVWRAHDTAANNRTVAIKLLPPHLAQDHTFVARFRREADAAARLNNPHIIPIHNYGEIDGRLYVDMRLIEGRDLQEVLADGPLESSRAVRIIEQVAKALHAAHKVGLIHRDVKPSNILLDDDDFAYLIDFGIARAADQTGLTGTGAIIGSWPYMSPERLRDGQVDARSDIYALACVLYECLTGSAPYPGDNFEQQITAHLTEPPPRPSSTDPNIPKQVDQVIATGMAKDPDQRYATTVELADAAHDAITTPLAPPAPTLLGDAPRPAPAPTRRHDQVPPMQRPAPAARQQAGYPAQPATQQRPPGWPPVPQTRPADRPSSHIGTSPPPWHRPRRQVMVALIAAIVVVLVAAGITGYLLRPAPTQTPTAQPAQPSGRTGRPAAPAAPTVLPFTGLKNPDGLAVDTAGNLYVTDNGNNRVLKLAAGSATPIALPFTGLNDPRGVAVDGAGNLYVSDTQNNRVLELAAGSSTPIALPFTGLTYPEGVAVDAAGAVYVPDGGDRVVKLAAGSSTQTVLPFTGINNPRGVAVDTAGSVYVADLQNNRVLMLAAGSSTQSVLALTGFDGPQGVAVDTVGAVYVTDSGNNRVVKLAAGSSTPTELAFTGLNNPHGVAVDAAGNVYVADVGNSRVLKLAAG
ncbi:MAG: protein kinase [Mycobacterium sp.]|uniref:serine/threonine-protein kinase PknD n=1 Tax=Mycobacterium sp. TaxID=1785 RepID=UPI003BAF5CBF